MQIIDKAIDKVIDLKTNFYGISAVEQVAKEAVLLARNDERARTLCEVLEWLKNEIRKAGWDDTEETIINLEKEFNKKFKVEK